MQTRRAKFRHANAGKHTATSRSGKSGGKHDSEMIPTNLRALTVLGDELDVRRDSDDHERLGDELRATHTEHSF